MAIFSIHHITKYEYSHPVKESLNQIKIHPLICPTQEILQHDLSISHNPDLHVFQDYWGNRTGIFTITEPHKSLTIESKLLVRTIEQNIPDTSLISAKRLPVPGNDLLLTELSLPEQIARQIEIFEIAESIQKQDLHYIELIQACNRYIFDNFQYIKGITDYETTVDEILEHKSGVCQDFAHVLLQILRTLNIPCKYVSGYICPNKNGMRGEGATHAWVEAWIPGYGWAGIDPTNNVWVKDNHVKLSTGRNFYDCSPAKGTFKGAAKQQLSVYVSVGYEDGHIFEEMNDVGMEINILNELPEEEVIFIPGIDQQMQQQ
ncbi:MAG: transglutaminase domain-containing protein [Bacteroidota bacterium]